MITYTTNHSVKTNRQPAAKLLAPSICSLHKLAWVWLWTMILAFGMIDGVKGQELRAGGGIQSNDPYRGTLGYQEFGLSPLYRYVGGVTSGQLSLQSGHNNETHTLYFTGNNTLNAVANSSGNTSSAIDVGVKKDWNTSGNTLIITPYINAAAGITSPYPTLTATGTFLQSYAVMPGIGTSRNTIRMKGTIRVEATGAATSNQIDAVIAPGIGMFCREGSENTPSLNSGQLLLQDGARVRMTEQASASGSFQPHMLPKVTVENYATLWIQGWNKNSGQPSGTNITWASTEMKKNSKVSGDHIIANFTGYYTSAPSGWEALNIPYRSGGTINGELYVEYTPQFEFFVKLGQRQYIDYFTIAGIPSGPVDSNETAQMGYIGAAASGGATAYYPSLVVWNTNGNTNQTLTLNSTKYPVTGQLTANGNTIFNGNNNVATPREFKTESGGITFQASGANTLKLQNLTVNSGSKITVDGRVFMDLAASNRNQIAADVMKDKSGVSIYHYQTTLSTTGLVVEEITYDGVKVNNYYQNGNAVYLWLPVKSNKLVKITAKDASNNTITYYNNTLAATATHGQTFTVSRAIAIIGSVYYASLQTAFAVATNGQTITLIDNYAPTGEVAQLPAGVNATFDLSTFSLSGTPTLNANNGRLMIKGTAGQGKLTGITTIAGMVFADANFTDLGTIKRPGSSSEFVRYFAEKLLVSTTGEVCYSWGSGNDKTYFDASGKACLWIPKNMTGRLDFGYSADMTKDKCGEILAPTGTGTHGSGTTTVDPYLPINKTKVKIEAGGSLKITHNSLTVSGFSPTQPITVYGTTTTSNNIEVATAVNKLIIKDLSITHAANGTYTQAPIYITDNSTVKLFLDGQNTLKGGGPVNGVKAGIEVEPGSNLEVNNNDNGTGRLHVQGGYYGSNSGAGIGGGHGKVSGDIKILGGTIKAEGGLKEHWGIGNGKGANATNASIIIQAGSINTRRQWEDASTPKQTIQNGNISGGASDVYLVTVNTGLSKNTLYECTYPECVPSLFKTMTDENAQCFFWVPERTLDQNPVATFRDPNTGTTVTLPLVQVKNNDDNVAPIVCRLNVSGGFSKNYNSLLDAFNAVPTAAGTKATITLLANVSNLSTLQTVKTGTMVEFDLDRFNIDTQNSNTAGFSAEVGGYLFITGNGASGTGNIRSSFLVGGDVFIDGKVPLTDAATTSIQTRTAVYRTLLGGLSKGEDYAFTYTFGNGLVNQSFQVHDGLACLWLPGMTETLTVKETNKSNLTEYTAGTQTTNVHRVDVIEVVPVGVVAQLIKADKTVMNFKTLEAAFKEAGNNSGCTVMLKTNVSLTESFDLSTMSNFTFDLRGMSLTTSTPTISIKVPTGSSLYIQDKSETAGKNQLQCNWVADGKLFVASSVTMNKACQVTRTVTTSTQLYRVIAGVGNLTPEPVDLTLDGNISEVHDHEACFWKKAEASIAKLIFTANGGANYEVSNVSINADHQDNMFSLGGTTAVVRIPGKDEYDSFEAAWDAVEDGESIELLKDASIGTALTLGDKTVTVDLMRYNLTQTGVGAITLNNKGILVMLSSNKNSRMQVSVKITTGNLFVDASIQADRLTGTITNVSNETVFRTLVTNLPEGMPNGSVFTYTYGSSPAQTGSFYVTNQTACLWLKHTDPESLTFIDYGTTENVTISANHGNLVTWGQSSVAQVNGNRYSSMDEAFAKNTNATVEMLKTAVFAGNADAKLIQSEMKLNMNGFNVTPKDNSTSITIQGTGSLFISGSGSFVIPFQIDLTRPMPGSNANLAVMPDVSLGSALIQSGSTTYYRVSVTFPSSVGGEMTYAYGTETDKVQVIANQPLTLWIKTTSTSNNLRFVQTTDKGDKIYQASGITVQGTHVNTVKLDELTDEVHVKIGNSKVYHKTFAEAFNKVNPGESIVLERNITTDAPLSESLTASELITIDLNGHALASGKKSSFNAGSGQFLLKNGTMSGFLTIAGGNLFAEGSADIAALRVSDNNSKSVWRTLLTLPDGTISFSYKLGENGTSVTSTNIQTIGGKKVACLWLSSSNQALDLVVTVDGTEYALNNVVIASSHGNELDVTNNDPIAETGSKDYASLTSALAMAADGGTITLKKDILLSSIQTVTGKNVTLNLKGNSITSNSGGFDVATTGKKLTIQSSGTKKSVLSGTIRLSSEASRVNIDKTVDIAGFVYDKDNKTIYRSLVKVGPTAISPECHWLTPNPQIHDLTVTAGTDTYEATIPANYTDHNAELRAYKRVEQTGGTLTLNSNHKDVNLVLKDNAILTAKTATTLHRLTLHDGAKVETEVATNVIATEGIHYKRTFATASKWESIALPFTATRIVQIDATDKAKTTPLSPTTGTGTAGHFWLTTINNDGSLKDVTSSEMTANVAYLMAAPTDLKDKEITFVSGENQLLNRKGDIGVKPLSGFASYANETLDGFVLTDACYVLSDDGKNFTRITASTYSNITIPPFRGYLSADPATTTRLASFRVSGMPTGIELPTGFNDLKIRSGHGCLILESSAPVHIYIHSINGYCLRSFKFAGGRTEITLPHGVYIVNRQKVIVLQ